MRRRRIILSSVACPPLLQFFTFYLIIGTISRTMRFTTFCINFSQKFLILRRAQRVMTKNVYWSSYIVPVFPAFCTIFSQKFLILRRSQRVMTKNVYWSSYIVPFFCHITMKLEHSPQSFEKYSNINFHENLSSGRRIVQCGRTDEQRADVTETNSRFSGILRLRLNLAKRCEASWYPVWSYFCL